MRDDELLLDEEVLRRGLAGARYDVSDGEPAKVLWRRGRARRAQQQVVAVLAGAGVAAVVAAGGLTLLQQTRPPSAQPAGRDAVVVDTVDEVEVVAKCLREEGWDASAADDVLVINHSGGQDQVVADRRAHCYALINLRGTSIDGHTYQVTTPSEMQAHDLFVRLQPLADCLAEHGYEVAATPRAEVFASSLVGGSLIWHPYSAASAAGQLTAASTDCPAVTSPWDR